MHWFQLHIQQEPAAVSEEEEKEKPSNSDSSRGESQPNCTTRRDKPIKSPPEFLPLVNLWDEITNFFIYLFTASRASCEQFRTSCCASSNTGHRHRGF